MIDNLKMQCWFCDSMSGFFCDQCKREFKDKDEAEAKYSDEYKGEEAGLFHIPKNGEPTKCASS